MKSGNTYLKGVSHDEYEKGKAEALEEIRKAHLSTVEDGIILPVKKPNRLTAISACDLSEMDIPPIKWIAENILPEGVCIFGAKPKSFKSYLALGLMLAVCKGGSYLGFNTEKAECLYFDLESGHRRPKERISQILNGEKPPEGLHIVDMDVLRENDIKLCKVREGFEEQLNDLLDQYPKVRLVVIDVFGKIRKKKRAKDDAYQTDYEDIEPFAKIAAERGLAIILISHHTKGVHDDPHDNTVGSSGLMGSVDTSWSITKAKRSDSNAVLHVTGRDLKEQDIEMTFDERLFKWIRLGTPEELEAERKYKEYSNNNIVRSIKQALVDGHGKYEASAAEIKEYGLYHNLPIWQDSRSIGKMILEYSELLREDGISFSASRNSKGRKYIFHVTHDTNVTHVTNVITSQVRMNDM